MARSHSNNRRPAGPTQSCRRHGLRHLHQRQTARKRGETRDGAEQQTRRSHPMSEPLAECKGIVRPISAGSGFESLMAHKPPGQTPSRCLTFFFGHRFAITLTAAVMSLDAAWENVPRGDSGEPRLTKVNRRSVHLPVLPDLRTHAVRNPSNHPRGERVEEEQDGSQCRVWLDGKRPDEA